MILADKIMKLRKKNGWSQEELAEKMEVSRQAVSKWEGAQTVPDINRLLQLSELFGVTLDYLLKDEIEKEEFLANDVESHLNCVTLAMANEFMQWRKVASIKISIATFLCILSVIPLLLLGGATELSSFKLSENVACGLGLVLLFLIVTVAIVIFIYCDFKNKPYVFLDKESFELEYGVKGLVKEKQKEYYNVYMKNNIIGTCICIISPIPLFIGVFTENDFFCVIMLTITILAVGIGVIFFLISGIRWASMQKLLKEGEFTPEEKKKSRIKESIGTIYWLFATAIYLSWSFFSNDWHITWTVWVIAGILFAGVIEFCNLFLEKFSQK